MDAGVSMSSRTRSDARCRSSLENLFGGDIGRGALAHEERRITASFLDNKPKTLELLQPSFQRH